MSKRYTKGPGGFTLIELLVVVAIISLLSSVVLASLNTARARARDTKRVAEMKQFTTALELYRNDNGKYPTVGCETNGCSVSAPALSVLAPYMKSLPVDPKNSGGFAYLYQPSSDGSNAGIYFRLEASKDPASGGYRTKRTSASFSFSGQMVNANNTTAQGLASTIPW